MTLAHPKPTPRIPKRKGLRPTERAENRDRALDLSGQGREVSRRLGVRDARRSPRLLRTPGRSAHPQPGITSGPAVDRSRERRGAVPGHHDLLDKTAWFKPYFYGWLDTAFPGRRERLRQKALKS